MTYIGPDMGMSDVRQRASRPDRVGRLAFDLFAAKLHHPLMRPGTVGRASLIERLAHGDPCPIVSVVAPAGYGKTTLLSQWAERNGQAFAWVSVEEADNDPKVSCSAMSRRRSMRSSRSMGGCSTRSARQ